MRSAIDFSSWPSALATLLGLLLATLLMVGIRLLFMQTMQKRRERENRQINERLKTLIAAYKTLGGSFTGSLHVRPTHLRELRQAGPEEAAASSERQRRTRDAVEAALSDVILLGTPEQVALAAAAARDLAAGRSVETAALVVSLRQFIREALDLEPIAPGTEIPPQGPLRPGSGQGGGRRAGAGEEGGARRGAGGGGAAGAGGAGMGGMAMGAGLHRAASGDPDDPAAPT
ncbi:hypothetical protein [Alicycliphilus denitrificans]|jgi:uncharacterized membrane protein YgcG|uniref:hypothetical protein n=1 Tax=Alicycliphilus denitrificans TaxID=179636 RepID=UPI003A80BC8B